MTPEEIQCFAYQRGGNDMRASIIAKLSWPKSEALVKQLAGFPGSGWQQTAEHDIEPMLKLIVRAIDGHVE